MLVSVVRLLKHEAVQKGQKRGQKSLWSVKREHHNEQKEERNRKEKASGFDFEPYTFPGSADYWKP